MFMFPLKNLARKGLSNAKDKFIFLSYSTDETMEVHFTEKY